MSGEDILDKQVLDGLKSAIGDKVQHILQIFKVEVPKSIASMRAANKSGDSKTVYILVHSLKSSSANVGAMRLSKLAADLEKKVAEKTPDELIMDFDALEQAFDQVQPMFDEYL